MASINTFTFGSVNHLVEGAKPLELQTERAGWRGVGAGGGAHRRKDQERKYPKRQLAPAANWRKVLAGWEETADYARAQCGTGRAIPVGHTKCKLQIH
jgi:hypothetical protein